MNKEHETQLINEFPLLYADRTAPMTQTCMCWGFEVGDGWFPIIYALSRTLNNIMDNMTKEEWGELSKKDFRASQVKEKFGTLRYYMTCETKEMSAAIQMAEEWSEVTCEECGLPGKLHDDGWCSVRCDACWAKTHKAAA